MTTQQRLTALERSADQHDKQIKVIRDLVREGMRLMVETRRDLRTLATGLKNLTSNVNDLTNSMRRGSNGHTKRKVDLQ